MKSDTSIRRAIRYGLATVIYYLCGAFVAMDGFWLFHIVAPDGRIGALFMYGIFLVVAHMTTFDWEDFE